MNRLKNANPSLSDLHIGDWVQCWLPIPAQYSCYMKVSCLFDDGLAYLVVDEEYSHTPWEERIENIDGIPLTPQTLSDFGFEMSKVNPHEPVYTVTYRGFGLGGYLDGSSGRFESSDYHVRDFVSFEYIHQLQAYIRQHVCSTLPPLALSPSASNP